MKTDTQEQLRAYLEQCRHPDEQILAIEKIYSDETEKPANIILCILLALPLALVCGLAVWCPIPLGKIPFILMAIIAAGVLMMSLLHLYLPTGYFAVSDKSVYYCAGLSVYVWMYEEIALVECKPKTIIVTSTHQVNEVDYEPMLPTSRSRQNPVLTPSGKSFEYRQISLTHFFDLPRSRDTYIAKNLVNPTRRLKFRFGIGNDSALRGAFVEAIKKNPHVKLECDGVLVRQ